MKEFSSESSNEWIKEEAVEWYKLHRDRNPEQKITSRFHHLK
jgi:hypothetical protein